MPAFFKYIILFTSCLITSLLLENFMSYNFQRKLKGNYVLYFGICTFFNFLVNIFGNIYLNYFYSFLYYLILTNILYQSKEKNIYLQTLLFFGFNVILENFSVLLTNILFEYYGITDINYFFATLCATIGMLIIFKPVKYLISDHSLKNISFFNLLEMFLLILSCISIFLLSFFLKINLPKELNFILIFICFVMLIYVIFDVFVLERIDQNKKLKNKLERLEIERYLNQKYYQNKIEQYNRQQKIIHDIKSHLSVIEKLYKDGNYNEGTKHTNQLLQHLSSPKPLINNKILNTFLYDYIDKCRTLNVDFTYDIDSKILFNQLDDYDTISLFSNILENALEASQNCKVPKIYMQIYQANQMIIIELKNSYASKIQKKNGLLISSKPNHRGLGLNNVHEVVQKYNGILDISYNDSIFTIILCIPVEFDNE